MKHFSARIARFSTWKQMFPTNARYRADATFLRINQDLDVILAADDEAVRRTINPVMRTSDANRFIVMLRLWPLLDWLATERLLTVGTRQRRSR